jgi:tetratricopeptide (TPR) repeat protein
MKPIRLAVLLVVVFLAGWRAASRLAMSGRQEQRVQTVLAQGLAALGANDPDAAIAKFDQVIGLAPDTADAYTYRGMAYERKKEYERALADFTEGIRRNPQSGVAHFSRGVYFQERGDSARAIEDFTAAIGLEPTNGEYYIQRGRSHADNADFDQALADHMQAIRCEPDQPDGYMARARVHEKQKHFGEAVADYTEAVRVAPRDPEAVNNLAWLWATCPEERWRDGAKALESAQLVCKLTEWKEPFYFDTLAAAYAELGQFDEAVKWQRKALASPEAFSDDKERDQARRRLQLYEQRQPFREE